LPYPTTATRCCAMSWSAASSWWIITVTIRL
jgi:hypothetical protein